MTAPGGEGNNINLAALWVPVMPETSGMGEAMKKAGAESKRAFEEGFNSSGSSPEALGNSFSSKLNQSMASGLKNFELPFGISGVFERMGSDIDEKLVGKLKGEATQALKNYTAEYENLSQAQAKAADVESRLNIARDGGFNKASIMLPLMSEQTRAQNELTEANKRTGVAYDEYNVKAGKLSEVTQEASGHSNIMAGIMGGAMVAGINFVTQGIEEFGEKFIEFGVETLKEGIEVAHEFADTMIEIGESYEKIEIQTTEFSSATGEKFEELTSHAQRVFGELDVAGANTGKTMAQFSSMLDAEPGEALDRLTKHVEELQGRFTTLRTNDLATSFVVFKTPVEEADKALASLLQSARTSGQDLGQLTAALSGSVGITLKEAGLNLEQAGAFTGELLKMGAPGRQAMGGLATAMKDFTKEGVGFSEGMKEAGKQLEELGDTAAGQDLAEKLFGTRNWIVAKAAVQDYMEVVNQGPNAFGASSESLDEFIEHTRTLSNEWEEVKHKAMEAFAPMGEAAVGLVSSGLTKLKAFIHDNMNAIRDDVKAGGHFFIQFAHDAQVLAQGLLAFFGPIVNIIDTVMAEAIGTVSNFGHVTGEMLSLIPGFEDMGNGLIDASKEGEKFSITLGKLNVGDKMEKLSEWIKQHPIDVEAAGESWDHFADHVTDAMDGAGSKVDEFGNKIPGLGDSLSAAAGFPPGPPGFGPGGIGRGPGDASASGSTGGIGSTGGPHHADWDAIAAKEGGGKWNVTYTTGVPEGGGLQIKPATWAMYGGPELTGTDKPYMATKDQQIAIAERILNGWNGIPGQGPQAWDNGRTYVEAHAAGGAPGHSIDVGSGTKDDVAALLKRGEYVWDTDTVDKYGWLIKALHQGSLMGFDQGGGLDTQGAQVDTIAVARAAQTIFGINDIGLYRSPDGYNEHASGEAADVMVAPIGTAATGRNKAVGDAVAQYFLSNAQGFGVSYVLWQQHQWNPDGSSSPMQDRGSPTGNHLDHVHVRTRGGGFPGGDKPQGFAAPRTGKTDPAASPIAAATVGGGAMMYTGAGGGDTPGGSNGYMYPGLPGQYGGMGVYGGMTADQAYSTAHAVQEAKDRAADMDAAIAKTERRIKELQDDLNAPDDVKTGALGHPLVKTPAEAAADAKRRRSAEDALSDATEELAKQKRDRAQQDDQIAQAERKQSEAQFKAPPGSSTGKAGKVTGEAEFAKLGSSLLGGIGQELGFGDLFSKAPWEWGAVKLLTGAASWAMGTANAWADEIGKGHTGMTGFQPIAGWDNNSGGGAGMLSGLAGSLGINLPKSNISAGPNVVATQPGQIGTNTGPMGSVLPGPVTIDNSINVSSDVDPSKVMGPVHEERNSVNSAANTHTGGMPQ